MAIEKKDKVFSTIEEAFQQDIKESVLTFQQFASLMWPDRNLSAAYNMLYNKLDINRRPDFTISEVLRGCLIAGKSENTMRFISSYLGYKMPIMDSESEDKIAEQQIKQIDDEMNDLQLLLYKKLQRKMELEAKIKKVPRTKGYSIHPAFDGGVMNCKRDLS